MNKSICKIVFVSIIVVILVGISISGCIDKTHPNVGIEKLNHIKIIKIPDKSNINYFMEYKEYNTDLFPFDSNPNFPTKLIIQPPKEKNGWSILAPEVINIVYEKDQSKSRVMDGLDNYVEDDTEGAGIPVNIVGFDQYSSDELTNTVDGNPSYGNGNSIDE